MPTLGRVRDKPPTALTTKDEVTLRLEAKMNSMSRYLSVITDLPKPPTTS